MFSAAKTWIIIECRWLTVVSCLKYPPLIPRSPKPLLWCDSFPPTAPFVYAGAWLTVISVLRNNIRPNAKIMQRFVPRTMVVDGTFTLIWLVTRQTCLQMGRSWWRHQMETFPRCWPFVRGIHRSPVTIYFWNANDKELGEWAISYIS